jgi:amino acid transporter
MPSHLKIFFWLVAAVAAYWVGSMLWVMEFPPAEMTAALAKIPAAMRADVARNAWQITLVSTAVRVTVFVGLAWLAAFRRQNWARWLLLALFVLSHSVPFAIAMRLGRMQEFLSRYHDWQADVIAVVIAVALGFAFTGNARKEFQR